MGGGAIVAGDNPGKRGFAMDMTWGLVDRPFGYGAGCGINWGGIPIAIPFFFFDNSKIGKSHRRERVKGYGGALLNSLGSKAVVLTFAGGCERCEHKDNYVFHDAK